MNPEPAFPSTPVSPSVENENRDVDTLNQPDEIMGFSVPGTSENYANEEFDGRSNVVDWSRNQNDPGVGGVVSAAYPRVVESTFSRRLIPLLYQTRLLTTRQITDLLTPASATSRYGRQQLATLRQAGLVEAVPASQITGRRPRPANPKTYAWFLTEPGVELAESVPGIWQRPYRMTAAKAAGPAQGHLLCTNTVGVAFAQAAARLAGHECGPGDWDLEIVHRYADRAPGSSAAGLDGCVVTDAVLAYSAPSTSGGRWQRQYLIELDNGTMSVPRVAAKLAAYGRYATYRPGADRNPRTEPAWRRRYTRLPAVLVVLTGINTDGLHRRLERIRAETLPQLQPRQQTSATTASATTALTATNSGRRRLPIQVAFTTMHALLDHGPFGDIWLPIDQTQLTHAGAL